MVMPIKKRKQCKQLGIAWDSLGLNEIVLYEGTYSGLKNNVCRANRSYAPKKFKIARDKQDRLCVQRIA